MKKRSIIFFLITISMMFFCCGRVSFDRKLHTVTEIIDGNTIKVDRGVYIHLIGIENTNQGKRFLNEYVLKNKVRIKYDSRKREIVRGHSGEIWAYVATYDRISINAELLKRSFASIDTKYLNDSLEAFNNYSQGLSYTSQKKIINKHSGQNNIKPKPTNSNEPSVKKIRELADIVKDIEPAVFAVQTYDNDGNGIGYGTGFFISNKGLGVSNYHVFEGGSKWYVKTIDDNVFQVEEIIAQSNYHDYIIFQVKNNGSFFEYLKLGNKIPNKGDDIFVLGNPKGLESTLTRGVVSAIRSEKTKNDFIQIDAAISHGSSGSPVLNMNGLVIGIATLKQLECENCNYALNIQLIIEALNN